jgi:hypothetical protein
MNKKSIRYNNGSSLPLRPASLLACVVLAQVAWADEYSLEYGVEAGYEYDDNVRLTPDQEIDISGGVLSVPITLSARTETRSMELAGQLDSSKFNESDYDSNDQDIQGKINQKFERGDLEGYAGYTRDSTRTSEFLDTGVVGLDAVRREAAKAGISGSQLITEKNGVIGGIDYLSVDFAKEPYVDYNFYSGYLGGTHQWSERTRLRLQAYANRYENGGQIDVTSDTIGGQAGFDSDLSEKLTTSLLAGWAEVDTTYNSNLPQVPNDDNDGALLFQASVTYREERYQLAARFLDEPQPSADGVLVESRRMTVDYRYRLTERSRLDLALTGGQRQAVSGGEFNERDYARGSIRLDYRLSSSWYVAGRYVYSWQDQKQATGDADSNAVYLNLIYQPEKLVWSR